MIALLAALVIVFPGTADATPLQPVRSTATARVPEGSAAGPWAVRLPSFSRDYAIAEREPAGWTIIASGHGVPLDGVVLPPRSEGREIRIEASIYESNAEATLRPAFEVFDDRREFEVTLLFFAGFFLAMALVNAMSSLLMRSPPSAWYTGLSLSLVAIMLFSTGLFRPVADAHPLGLALEHALLLIAYFGCVVGFAFSLLSAFSRDRLFSRIVLGLYAVNVVLIVIEDLQRGRWAFYAVDQIALDLLLVSLVVLGFRAVRSATPGVATSYLIAFAGPLAGIPLNDLATHNLIGGFFQNTFEIGSAWEAAFFAFAVALRNRAVRSERDWFDRLAHSDPLTGVANRRRFDEMLAKRWAGAIESGGSMALVMIDIDHFKAYNDRHGHRHGDEVLRSVAQACSSVPTREFDCFARYGGEEFAAILTGADLEGAAAVAERMRAAVAVVSPATISAGVAAARPAAGSDPDALVAAADAALYEAKRRGRNVVVCADQTGSPLG